MELNICPLSPKPWRTTNKLLHAVVFVVSINSNLGVTNVVDHCIFGVPVEIVEISTMIPRIDPGIVRLNELNCFIYQLEWH